MRRLSTAYACLALGASLASAEVIVYDKTGNVIEQRDKNDNATTTTYVVIPPMLVELGTGLTLFDSPFCICQSFQTGHFDHLLFAVVRPGTCWRSTERWPRLPVDYLLFPHSLTAT